MSADDEADDKDQILQTNRLPPQVCMPSGQLRFIHRFKNTQPSWSCAHARNASMASGIEAKGRADETDCELDRGIAEVHPYMGRARSRGVGT